MEKKFKIIDPLGLHARPASKIVQKSSSYDNDITISLNSKKGNLKSIMSVMSLGIRKNDEITIEVKGKKDEKVLKELEDHLRKEKIID